jgi:hypothetical protein
MHPTSVPHKKKTDSSDVHCSVPLPTGYCLMPKWWIVLQELQRATVSSVHLEDADSKGLQIVINADHFCAEYLCHILI